jgi:SAM-dependent methyltransferase
MPTKRSPEDRTVREQIAYDAGTVWRNNDRLHRRFFHVFDCPNSARGEQFLTDITARVLPGRDILDYGCYDGWMIPTYAQAKPRRVVGIDISEKAIEKAKSVHGSLAEFFVADAHQLMFPESSFDVVIGRGILHHLDFKVAIHELYRILRPGGCAIFVEPLGDNPGAKLFRALTPNARTPDERPLSRQQIVWADQVFGISEHYFINFISTPLALITSSFPLKPDNAALRFADQIDVILAGTILRFWMRSACLVWRKRIV